MDIDVSESDHLGLGPTLNSYAVLSKLVSERGDEKVVLDNFQFCLPYSARSWLPCIQTLGP